MDPLIERMKNRAQAARRIHTLEKKGLSVSESILLYGVPLFLHYPFSGVRDDN